MPFLHLKMDLSLNLVLSIAHFFVYENRNGERYHNGGAHLSPIQNAVSMDNQSLHITHDRYKSINRNLIYLVNSFQF